MFSFEVWFVSLMNMSLVLRTRHGSYPPLERPPYKALVQWQMLTCICRFGDYAHNYARTRMHFGKIYVPKHVKTSHPLSLCHEPQTGPNMSHTTRPRTHLDKLVPLAWFHAKLPRTPLPRPYFLSINFSSYTTPQHNLWEFIFIKNIPYC